MIDFLKADPGWNTAKEITFLSNIGQWSRNRENPEGTGLPRKELLIRYWKSLLLRKDWDKIDRKKVSEYISVALLTDYRVFVEEL